MKEEWYTSALICFLVLGIIVVSAICSHYKEINEDQEYELLLYKTKVEILLLMIEKDDEYDEYTSPYISINHNPNMDTFRGLYSI